MVFSPIQHHGNQLVRHLMASKPAAWPLQRAIKRIQAGYHTTPWLDPVDPKRHRKRANFHGKIWGNGQGKFGWDKFVNVTNHFYGNVGSFNYDNIPGRWGVGIYEDEIWSDGKEGWVKLCLKKKGLVKYQTWPNAYVFVFGFSKLNCDTSCMLAPLGVIVDCHLSHCKHLQQVGCARARNCACLLSTGVLKVERMWIWSLKILHLLSYGLHNVVRIFKIRCLPRSFNWKAKELHQDLEVANLRYDRQWQIQ